jgi:nitrate reductase NapE
MLSVKDHVTASRKDETLAFLALAVVLAPVLAVIFVGGFGFLIWMQHLIFGPPAG